MSQILLFDEDVTGLRAAVMSGEQLTDLFIFPENNRPQAGFIFLGRISSISKELDAAFVDLGDKQEAFLKLNDIPDHVHLHEGLKLVVQVIKDTHDGKPRQVSGFLKLEGPYCLFSPEGNGLLFSKKFKDDARKNTLKTELSAISKENRITIRSEAIIAEDVQILSEISEFNSACNTIQQTAQKHTDPRLLYSGPTPPLQITKRFFQKSTRILTNSVQIYRDIKADFPSVTLWTETDLLFDHFDVEDQIEQATNIRLSLPSGGWISLEKTEALHAIDVNSGSNDPIKSKDALAVQTNKEAAALIAKQIRLRNIAGIIIVDFLKMNDKGAVQNLTTYLQEATHGDPSPVRVVGMTELGLMQMTRKRQNADLQSALNTSAFPHISAPSFDVATRFLKELQSVRQSEKRAILTVKCGAHLATFLNQKQAQIEVAHSLTIKWSEDPALPDDDCTISQ